MFKERQSDYRDFLGATSTELGYGAEVVDSRVVDYRTDEGQRIGVFMTEPKAGYDKTILIPAQHEYRNEPLVMRRAEIMASQTGSRVAVIETPGTVGLVHASDAPEGYSVYESTRKLDDAAQTPRQLMAAIRGDFSEHAALQLDAATDTLGLTASDHLTLFGESMGAVTSTEIVRHIGRRGLSIENVVLHEAVNPSEKHGIPWLIPLLGNLGGIESRERDRYLAENETIGHPIVAFEQSSAHNLALDKARKSPRQQLFGGLANGLGMRAGIAPKLIEAYDRLDGSAPRTVLIRAQDSTVSDAGDYTLLHNELRDHGFEATAIRFKDSESLPIRHFFLFSLGRQAMFARQLNDLIN